MLTCARTVTSYSGFNAFPHVQSLAVSMRPGTHVWVAYPALTSVSLKYAASVDFVVRAGVPLALAASAASSRDAAFCANQQHPAINV